MSLCTSHVASYLFWRHCMRILLESHSTLVWFRSSLSPTNWQMENRRQPLWQAYSSSSYNTNEHSHEQDWTSIFVLSLSLSLNAQKAPIQTPIYQSYVKSYVKSTFVSRSNYCNLHFKCLLPSPSLRTSQKCRTKNVTLRYKQSRGREKNKAHSLQTCTGQKCTTAQYAVGATESLFACWMTV
jgi:hypothetical protein